MTNIELRSNITSTSSTPDNVKISIGTCFVIAPIGNEGSPERLHSDEVFKEIIKPAAEECGYDAKRADHWTTPGMIPYDVIESIAKSPLVIANLSGNNPNVYYELALRHTLEKPVIIIVPDYQDLPFDIVGSRAILFNVATTQGKEICRQRIVDQIKAIQKSPDNYFNPISQALNVITALDDAQFTLRDVHKELSQISDLRHEDIVKQYVGTYYTLKSQGILTKRELRELMSNNRVLDILRNLYRDELLRSIEHPLDPMAIASWGVSLFITDQSNDEKQLQEAVVQITEQLRKSGEYIRKHGDLVIHSAWYGYREGIMETDITRILQAKVNNNSLEIKVSHIDFGIEDPAENVRKQLRVVHSYHGQQYPEMFFPEDFHLKLPL